MNLSRAYSLLHDDNLSVGRVQTPTLSIVVEREEKIRKHVARDYWELRANFDEMLDLLRYFGHDAEVSAMRKAGIKVICYNFMPVVDWCRTDLEWELPNGARAMRFDQDRFAAFGAIIWRVRECRPSLPTRKSPRAMESLQSPR